MKITNTQGINSSLVSTINKLTLLYKCTTEYHFIRSARTLGLEIEQNRSRLYKSNLEYGPSLDQIYSYYGMRSKMYINTNLAGEKAASQ